MAQQKAVRVAVKNLWSVFFFSAAMAYVESAAVIYLRRINGTGSFAINPGPFDAQIACIEIGREIATLIMLLAVGWVAGKHFQSRLGYAILSFGIWDFFYYIWLNVLTGWPATLMDMDLLFLIPLPWWGPVLSPVFVAMLMCISGARMVVLEDRGITIKVKAIEWSLLAAGILVILYSFMRDALAMLPATAQDLSTMQPRSFAWPIFLAGFGLMVYTAWKTTFHQTKSGR